MAQQFGKIKKKKKKKSWYEKSNRCSTFSLHWMLYYPKKFVIYITHMRMTLGGSGSFANIFYHLLNLSTCWLPLLPKNLTIDLYIIWFYFNTNFLEYFTSSIMQIHCLKWFSNASRLYTFPTRVLRMSVINTAHINISVLRR